MTAGVTIISNPARPAEDDDDCIHAVEIPALHMVCWAGVRVDAFLSLERAEALARTLRGE